MKHTWFWTGLIAMTGLNGIAGEIQVDVLTEGNRLKGTTTTTACTLHTSFATIPLDLETIKSIDFDWAEEQASLITRNGDRLKGVLDLDDLKLKTLVGDLTIPLHKVERLECIPPIHIEGMEKTLWTVNTKGIKDWDFKNTDGVLQLHRIEANFNNPGGGGTWSSMTFEREVSLTGDFSLETEFEWTTGKSIRAMDRLILRLFDPDGAPIVHTGYYDAWWGHRGAWYATAGDQKHHTGHDALPHAGTAQLLIKRENGVLTLWRDDVKILTATSATEVGRIALEFAHYPSRGNRFDSLAVRRLHIPESP
ncbi:MAG: hypothetical protein AAF492_02895 [Verrucomicrobiota bacterium]